MKQSKFRIMLIGASASMLMFYACSKNFLDKAPIGSLDQNTLSNKAGVEGVLIGAYSMLDGYGGAGGGWQSAGSNWVYGGVASDDAYKGSDPGDQADIVPIETYTATASNGYFNQKWQAVYDAIQRSNDVLRLMTAATDISAADKARITGEARFLRAHYHMEAKKMWNNIPYVDETITYAAGNFNVPNDKDAWVGINADLDAAIANLPATQSSVGRANSWAAKALKVKALMFQKNFAAALTLAKDVIANGVTTKGTKYALTANMFDNFNAETKNSSEAIFSTQQSVNDNSGGGNGGWGDVLNFPYNGGPGGCCGFYQPSISLANSYKVDANGLPLLDTWNATDFKNDQGIASGSAFTPDVTTPVDPRLDFTIGRRGIPYLDWGLHPGNDWIRDQNNGGPYAPIKHVYYKRQAGALTDNSFWTAGVTANNYTFIRFADVLLWAAEAEVEVGSLANAVTLVNQVRNRVKSNPSSWVKQAGGANAANYQVGLYTSFPDQAYGRKAVRFERKLELAMEGHRFFDLVRYGIADVELNAYIAKEKAKRTFFVNSVFTKGKSEYFPVPQSQIDLSKGVLKQNPGY
ncbi:MAG: hypothetical protein RLY89_2894 [Bacteroidota bacterium]|jgi:hypothetical protein